MCLHPDVFELVTVLRALERHLRTHDDSGWSQELARCAVFLERSDYHGIERFWGLFGGMGSLNDLVLQCNGRWLTAENDELHGLLVRAKGIAQTLRDEQVRLG
jgi:hypothetical protein